MLTYSAPHHYNHGLREIHRVAAALQASPISATGQSRRLRGIVNVRSAPDNRHFGCRRTSPIWATRRPIQRSKAHLYSITSSAIASSDGGMSMPSAFAVFRLMVSSNLVGCSTGRSAGTAPFNILST
jgi:hypothetical protein